MRLQSIEIENYKSFWDKQVIYLEPGFNLFLGTNNSGKTTALEALDLTHLNEPHRSILSIENYGRNPETSSKITTNIVTNLQELRRLKPGNIHIPLPTTDSMEYEPQKEFFSYLINNNEFSIIVEDGDSISIRFKYPQGETKQFSTNVSGIVLTFPLIAHTTNKTEFSPASHSIISNEIAAYYLPYHTCVYRFSAQRLPAAQSPMFPTATLQNNASNLAFCINRLQSTDAYGHKLLCEWINRVFPHVHWIQAPTNDGNLFELRCLPLPPESRRDDLAVRLDRMGAGIGNVIAMLYVVLTSRHPQVISIDEPNSFLHPRALRELLQILRSEAQQHQIILTAHSADVLTAIKPSMITMFEFDGSKTTIKQVDALSISDLKSGLSDLGIRMTDLHGRDRVLWVEGQTEELVVPELLSYFCPEIAAGTAVLRVEHTGTFEKSGVDPKEVAKIYKRLTESSALVPPMTAILLDSELHKDNVLISLKQESKGLLNFLERRMLENYVLDAEAIANRLNILGENVSVTDVEMELEKNSITQGIDLKKVNGAKILKDIFNSLTESRHEFRKVQDVPELINFLIQSKAAYLNPLGNSLRELFDLAPKL